MNFILPQIEDGLSLQGKRILVRLDLNVPLADGQVVDDFRIRNVLPTITDLCSRGAKVIVLSHIGRDPEASLVPVLEYLKRSIDIGFVPDIYSPAAKETVSSMEPGAVVLFENLRRWPGEGNNDSAFSKYLASFGDIYINEAFPVSHRDSASVVGLPALLPHYAGRWFVEEVTHLSRALTPPSPFLFVLGGAKFETKLPLLKKFLSIADNVFLAGALMSDLFKARGYEIGDSLVAEEDYDSKGVMDHPKLVLPVDVTVETKEGVRILAPDALSSHDRIVDIGPQSSELLRKLLTEAKFVLWNGPLGDYEHGYGKSSEMLALDLASSSARSVLGGGDTLAVIDKLGIGDRIDFISTAGGAMLQFLQKGTLPGIEALLLPVDNG